MGDFILTTSNAILSQVLPMLPFSLLNIDPNYFKNSKNPILLPTNFWPSFMKTNVFKTGISNLHKMISTTMKLHFTGESPETKHVRDYCKY